MHNPNTLTDSEIEHIVEALTSRATMTDAQRATIVGKLRSQLETRALLERTGVRW